MPRYTLQQLKDFNIPLLHQCILFGNTIEEIECDNPNRIIYTWLDLDKFKIIVEDEDFKPEKIP